MQIESDAHVVNNCHLLKQADILEGARDAGFYHLMRFFTRHQIPIEINGALGWLINACQHIEHSCLTRAVRTD